MFDPQQKSTGTGYTTTVALLAVAFIFVPLALILLRPFGAVSVVLAITCSAICTTFAWFNWKKSSQLTIRSISTPAAEGK